MVLGLVTVAVGIGAAGYHYLGNLPWLDAALNAAMILTGKAGRATLDNVPQAALRIDKRTLADVLPAVLKRSDNHAAETILRMGGKLVGLGLVGAARRRFRKS